MDADRSWKIIYPAYINANHTLKKGRRISKQFAVENPTYQEIGDVFGSLGLDYIVESTKHYSREPDRERWQLGRVKVKITDENGNPVNSQVPTKNELMKYTASMIPKLKSRSSKQSDQQQASTSNKGKKKKNRK